jgi:hypothetical protein
MPAGYRFQWNGEKFLALLRAELRRRIAACCVLVANHARHLLDVEGAGQAIRKHAYWYGGRKRTVRKKGLVYGHSTSAPGEPPRKQTGRLLGSVAWEIAGSLWSAVAGRVGTNTKYAKALELGAKATRHSAWGKPTNPYQWLLLARPWLRRALKEMTPAIRAIMGRQWMP